MFKHRKLLIILVLIFISVILLSIGHYLNIDLIIILSLMIFLTILLKSPKTLFLAIMLFYLPWSPVMKFNPEDHTFYTICFVLYFLYLIFHFEFYKKIGILKLENLILFCSLFIYTMAIKLVLGYNISLGYIVFMFMLVFIPTYLKMYYRKISFEICIIFFSLGIVSAAFSAKLLMKNAYMLQFIKVSNWETIGLTRLSGFYGDANFYSAHILVAVSGLLILIINKNFKEVILKFVLVLTLIYFGLLSVSKMFLIGLLLILIVWLLVTLSLKGKVKTKILIFMIISFGCLIIFTTEIFANQINMYLVRFSMVSDFSTLTTGRSDILSDYLTFFKENPIQLLFGQGYTEVYKGNIKNAAHNTLIQLIYQFGIIGSILLFFWFIHILNILGKSLDNNVTENRTINLNTFVFAIACFIPWLSLDILFADEFFFITSLFLISINHFNNSEKV